MIHNIDTYGSDVVKMWGYNSDLIEKYSKMARWGPIIKLQVEGKLAEAWEKTKIHPEFLEMMKYEPALKEYWNMNEAGKYEEAHDAMMKWKIEKYGREVMESWGYDLSKYSEESVWTPIVKLQVR